MLLSIAMFGYQIFSAIGFAWIDAQGSVGENLSAIMGLSRTIAVLALAEVCISIASTVYSLQPFVNCCRRKQYSVSIHSVFLP